LRRNRHCQRNCPFCAASRVFNNSNAPDCLRVAILR
jgi:hypothetical protein